MIKLMRFLQPYKLLVAGVLVFLFVQALAELYLPTLMADIVDTGVVQQDTDYIIRVGGIMLLVSVGSVVCSVVATFLSSLAAVGFGRDLRTGVFTQVSGFSLHEFDKVGTATLITRTTNDVTQVQQVLILIMRMMVTAPLMAIGGIIMAVAQDPTLSLLIVVAVPVLAGAIAIIAFKAVPLFRAMQQKVDRLNLVLRERLIGVRVIRAFNRNDYETRRFDEANTELTVIAIRVNRILAFLMPVLLLVMNFTTIAIIWFGGLRIDSGDMQVGSLMAFMQYVMQIMFSMLMVSLMFVMVPRAEASAIRINQVLVMTPEIQDAPQVREPVAQRGHVEFRNVTFSYPGAEQPALCDISFTAGPGEVVAIIGGTGAGKSTLINLIPRFYDVDSGSVLVDGVDVREMSQESLRQRIGFVTQQAVLFSGSITANIRYGNDAASDEAVQQAAATAQAEEFILHMPETFQSTITQGGTNVSGGQKQRLAIARALARRPEIYIFDDSFSALDFKTDARLRRALKQETADATVIIVAQRVSTILDATRIIVLDEGEIVGMGSHRELLKTSEVYREIVASQLSEEELAA